MKKIIIFGANGLSGHTALLYLRSLKKYSVIGIDNNKNKYTDSICIDYFQINKIKKFIFTHKPDIIVYVSGILNQFAEEEPDKAILVNSFYPHFLAKISFKINSLFITKSTDCVFSGIKGNYTENDMPDGLGYYSRSRALGEMKNDNILLLRTSIIGPEINPNGIGLFTWFMKQKGQIKGYTQAFWTGITSYAFAKCLEIAIDKKQKGFFNLVNNQKISKHDLLVLFKEYFHRNDIDIIQYDNPPNDKSLVNTKKNSIFNIPTYTQMIYDMREWMNLNRTLYSNFYKF